MIKIFKGKTLKIKTMLERFLFAAVAENKFILIHFWFESI